MENCCSTAGLLPVDAAIALLRQAASVKTPSTEDIPITEALGRVLAEDVMSTLDVPPQANSAMDGYALNTQHLAADNIFSVSQRIAAGSAPLPLQWGTIARIFTGATIPDGADAVIMQENCQVLADGRVQLNRLPEPQDNIRPQGQDIANGQTILQSGDKLTPAAIGLLATIGKARVKVYRKLKVMFFCTGDELVEPGQGLAVGQIYNSNRAMLGALLQHLGFEAVDGGVIADNLPATQAALQQATQTADVIITTGGVSVGEEDHVKAAVESCGQLDLWKIAIKPGKPLAFGRVGETPFIGLPGNPQSVFVTFSIFARQFLLHYQGQRKAVEPLRVPVASAFSVNKAQKRREYVRAKLVQSEHGLVLEKHTNQSSGVLSSAVWADGLAIIEAETTVNVGQFIPFLTFSALGVA